ncbi:MAG: ScyA-related TPP-binding enzyme [Spirirestis rafaelensis WJT71-NPBG6]|nr:ScyA-related TPP-binding enzyme [Spirirestis rafaelensis WJT71-NPBG6]
MNTEFQHTNTNRSEKLEPDTYVELAPADATLLEHRSASSVLSPPTSASPHLQEAIVHPGCPSGILALLSNRQPGSVSVSEAVTKMLVDMGVKYAFGVSGGGIAPLWSVLLHQIEVLHFRHETGAVFAAIESYFASGRPAVVLTTTGPGITNTLTGILGARWDGAKIILLSPSTSASQRGRWAFQETSAYTMSNIGFFNSGALFHYATTLEYGDELPEISRRLAHGLARPGGFVAHLSIPRAIQSSFIETSLPPINPVHASPAASEATLSECVKLLSEGSFAIWVGFGARGAAAAIRELAERTGAGVMCSPRGKGIFPEEHPQFVGVTGFGGHSSVLTYMREQRPLRVLVLGTRLSEFTSFWNAAMVPSRGFVHIDIDPEVPGVAYPSAETFSVQSDVGLFVTALLERFPKRPSPLAVALPRPDRNAVVPHADGPVRPDVLMAAIQHVIVEGSDAVVLTEAGNSFAWGTHTLRFPTPGRYRVSTGFAAMGHAVTGVLGAALAHNGKAVAIVGDGAMLMNSEVSTAVQYRIPAVWIVLNDARYNMCEQGMALQGFKGLESEFPISKTDFVMLARSMGADGIRVERESDVQAALEKAMTSPVPFVVDVVIDPTRLAPIGARIEALISQVATESK